jgi:predicted extracellular nuclease
VNPPFDYVPASNAAYQTRLGEIAAQILDEMLAPDVILVQEAEDQDLCTFDGAFACGSTNDADGKPDTLQELAAAIASLGGPVYDAAYDRDGADDRGIVSGFLFRTDRVELLPAAADDPVLGASPTVDYRGAALGYNTDVQNPKALNADLPDDVDLSTGSDGTNVFTRPAQVGLFRLWRDGIGTSVFIDFYALSNHFSSTPNARVGQRTEQAAYNAAIVAALQASDPDRPIVVGGDLNVYPRPDDPFTPGHPLYPSDQLGPLYDVGLVNLYNSLVSQTPSSAYSYVFEGQAQTLDQIFLTPSLVAEFDVLQVAHVNSDWPADHEGDGPRGTSDHDPQVARLSLAPTLDRLEDLLAAFIASGDITGNNTARILQDRIDRARGFKESGQTAAYLAQLQAFANQVLGFTPQFITDAAGAALAEEADLLRELGG